MEAFKKQRAVVKGSITRVKTFVLTYENSFTVDISEFETREQFLQQAYENYCKVQQNIEDLDEGEAIDREEVETSYLWILSKLRAKIKQLNQALATNLSLQQSPAQVVPAGTQLNAKLPSLNIPSFSGKIEDWQAFIDLFAAIIDGHSHLDNVQKFLYLKGAVTGEALDLINNLPLTNDNYIEALDLLKNRYENKLAVINSHLKGMLNVSSITKGSGKQLRAFLTHIRQHVNSLKALKLPVKEWDVLLVFLFSQKLDYQTHKAYELEKGMGQRVASAQPVLPTLDEFLNFLENRCLALETVEVESSKGFDHQGNRDKHKEKYYKTSLLGQHDLTSNDQNQKCSFCNRDNHSVYKCYKFINLSLVDKRQFVQTNRLCYNCLGKSHGVTQCQIKQGCKTCNRRHHTLLHDNTAQNVNKLGSRVDVKNTNSQRDNVENRDSKLEQSNTALLVMDQDKYIGISHGVNMGITRQKKVNEGTVVACVKDTNSQVLLATAMVYLISGDGTKVNARALLDSGSQTSFITKKLFNKLKNVEYYDTAFNIGGITNKLTHVDKLVNLIVESQVTNYKVKATCAVLDKITCKIPQVSVDTDKIKLGNDIILADPFYYKPGDVDMLISADLYFKIIIPEIIKLGTDLPILQNSELGWLVCGTAPIRSKIKNSTVDTEFATAYLSCQSKSEDVNETIPKFWQLEEFSDKKFLSGDEKLSEKIFLDTCQRLDNGGFQVDLPMNNNEDYLKLGDSFYSAYKRFQFLERKFSTNHQLFTDYKAFIDEYVKLGHGKYVECNSKEIQKRVFLAHHCVIREEAASTKLRVVFDASSKTSSGLSLNDILLKGFTVQPELFDILMRFRFFEFVLVADIEKMYRMISVNPKQLFLQNILWRENSCEPLKIIELQTVTYGTKAAPFLATRCLNKLASDEILNYPIAAEAILNQCYVDDVLCGANSRDELVRLRDQLIKLLHLGGFSLHKWLSNDLTILQNSQEGNKSMNELKFENDIGKVLGIVWHPIHDTFKISIPDYNRGEKRVTKRLVLSRISQMFDPLGYVGPVIVTAKILMQELWVNKIGWDDELPVVLLEKWKTFSNNLHHLRNLQIPRWVLQSKEIVAIELHGFSDASMAAYGACAYIRTVYSDQSVSCNLLCSRSRIAPIKIVSLPRLELCGALLLSRMIHRVLSIINIIEINKVYLWTDSTIVLCWLKGAPGRWTTFVANRIAEMQELTTNFMWKHVRSQENPADQLSRGILANEIYNKIWLHGPNFLLNSELDLSVKDQIELINLPEKREKTVVLIETVIDPFIKWGNFSNFLRLQRAVAYCHKFAHRVYGQISVDELQHAHQTIIKQIQLECFQKEIRFLKLKGDYQGVFKESSVKCLNPFLDKEGILRINGRLAQSNMDFSQKFPILLPANHYVVGLIIRFEHLKLFHAGPQAVLANLRLKYWIVHGLVKVKSVLSECVICHRFKAKPANQMMGSLPADRTSAARPFIKVGIDFGGPLMIKQSRLRGTTTSKSYIALFICMVTKAIHIEVVSSLSTEAFIHTLNRFIARRGCPNFIYSDNATNFQGANHLLKEVYLFFKNQKNLAEINNMLVTREIEWCFIPPLSPHWGGLWEAGVKSAKFHLRRIVGNAMLTFEELTTVLAQIEAILNSRPLCPVSSDPSDLNCLTPAHFLIGEPLTSIPEKDVSDKPNNRLNFFQLCTKLKQNFWKRWSVEYLTRLQNRPKWFDSKRNLEVNTMVLLREDNMPPLKWRLGRVIKVMPGSDGRVRVVEVRTKDGVFARPIVKLSPLPFDV